MQEQKNLEAIMGLIMFGGNAKSDAMEAIAAAKYGSQPRSSDDFDCIYRFSKRNH